MTELRIYSPIFIKPIIENPLIIDWGFNESGDLLVDVKKKHAPRIKKEIIALGYEIF